MLYFYCSLLWWLKHKSSFTKPLLSYATEDKNAYRVSTEFSFFLVNCCVNLPVFSVFDISFYSFQSVIIYYCTRGLLVVFTHKTHSHGSIRTIRSVFPFGCVCKVCRNVELWSARAVSPVLCKSVIESVVMLWRGGMLLVKWGFWVTFRRQDRDGVCVRRVCV